ncbi:MAG: DNA-processing protein DprA [Deltaproteobacteria bacterium]|nr:DNA-processing protein DprA [Deltaproteobacteria bacterium]MDL1960569.1 DNA-processing protein DprA [Deltaproteobacteria bacterium]
MKPEELKAWIGLQLVPGVGNMTLRRLVEHFGSAKAVWEARPADFSDIARFPNQVRDALAKGPDEKALECSIDVLGRVGAWTITFLSKDYPSLLNEIQNPPALLYGVGDPFSLKKRAIAIVGSRYPSSYGLDVARVLSSELVQHGYAVVSGLALGIDTASHEAALRSGGNTIAIKGCGIDVAYPRQNTGLVRRIADHGAVITELPPGVSPEAKNFPIRNRIISGLSLGVVIVEANRKSGSLITASCALDQGREVMAVPGSIYSYRSSGTHWLIKQGARLVENFTDIMEELGAEKQGRNKDLVPGVSREQPELSPEEQEVFDKLGPYPQHIDDIAHLCGQSVAQVSGLLLRMELKDLIQAFPGQIYQLK